MAGTGPPPKEGRLRQNAPARGEWQMASGVGWQHGEPPPPPPKLLRASREAWSTWFDAWFAAFWTPADLPVLRQVIRLYDQVERGEYQRAAELRLELDAYGISPKGQADRRWKPPLEQDDTASAGGAEASGQRYAHLRAVN